MWAPAVEVFHRNHELVVRAELPGLTRNDVKVDVTDDSITLQGERKHVTMPAPPEQVRRGRRLEVTEGSSK